MVEKELHALEHSNDFHCTSSDKHFHEQEHNCSICDYTLPYAASLNSPCFEFAITAFQANFTPFSEGNNLIFLSYYKSTRAPPVA